MTKSSTIIIVLLVVCAGLLAWIAFVKPAEAPVVIEPQNTATSTPTDLKPATGPSVTPRPLHERIVITSPKSGAVISRNFKLTGKAPGNWFFEASAPVMVLDEEGSKVAQGVAKVEGDWMTTELVNFSAELSVNPAYSGPVTIVLLKDNPSGLPENEDSLEIPAVIN